MDLSTIYLGLPLPNPLVVGASPLADALDGARRLEDAGAAAIVMHSLFEEQITHETMASLKYLDAHDESFAEATTFFPESNYYVFGPDEYLAHLARLKNSLGIPVIASLNGCTPGGWLEYARLMEEAGADALELNVYSTVTDPDLTAARIERDTIEMVREVKQKASIPVAVKLSPFYSAFANFALELDRTGADGLVLFNRFFGTDIDTAELSITRTLHLSDSSELPLRLRGAAMLCGRVKASLAITGGVHTAEDIVKATMAGANVVQMVSALLKVGPDFVGTVLSDLRRWMKENEWESLTQMRGNMSLLRVPDPRAYERANYMQMLQTWQGPSGGNGRH